MAHLQINSKSRLSEIAIGAKMIFSALGKVNSFLYRNDPKTVPFVIAGVVYGGIASLGIVAGAGIFLQTKIGELLRSGTLSTPMLFGMLLALVAFYVLSKGAEEAIKYRAGISEKITGIALDRRLIDHSLTMDLGSLEDPEFVDSQERARYGRYIFQHMMRQQAVLCIGLIGIVTSAIVLAYVDPLLLAFALCTLVPNIIKQSLFGFRYRNVRDENQRERRISEGYLWALKEIPRLAQSRLFGHVEYLYGKHRLSVDSLNRKEKDLDLKSLRGEIAVIAATAAIYFLMALYLLKGYSVARYDIPALMMVVGSTQVFGSRINDFAKGIMEMKLDAQDYLHMETFLETRPRIQEGKASPYVFTATPDIAVQNISFAYPTVPDKQILNGCSLHIAAGEKIAIVGMNGGGKSTLLKLLTKFYAPTEGGILANGIPLESISQDSWLSTVLCSTQNGEIPEIPIVQAICGDDVPDWSRLQKAAGIARIDGFVSKLPMKYETRIGGGWNEGTQFSGGQLQRLKLAATMYGLLKPSVRIAMFDEPMSDCDAETKDSYYGYIRSLTDKTVIAVSHDHAYLHHFDRVIEIKDGIVHKDLSDPKSIAQYQNESLKRKSVEEMA